MLRLSSPPNYYGFLVNAFNRWPQDDGQSGVRVQSGYAKESPRCEGLKAEGQRWGQRTGHLRGPNEDSSDGRGRKTMWQIWGGKMGRCHLSPCCCLLWLQMQQLKIITVILAIYTYWLLVWVSLFSQIMLVQRIIVASESYSYRFQETKGCCVKNGVSLVMRKFSKLVLKQPYC